MILNKRQDKILDIINIKGEVSISQILKLIKEDFQDVSRITINRDLLKLLELNYIVKKGKTRNIAYSLTPYFNAIKPIDIEEYFNAHIDKRNAKEGFNYKIFTYLINIFTARETAKLVKLNNKYQDNLKRIEKSILKKEYERLTIELSWKSSLIEGNTYSLLESEHLIKEKKESGGHTRHEAIMILNHKETLDYIRNNSQEFRKLTIRNIENVHYLLTKGLNIPRNLRKSIVKITGTRYVPLDNNYQIQEAILRTCDLVNSTEDIFSKVIITMMMLAYIQPFNDGNKRTSRLMGNAVLMANNACPLSFRSIDVMEYKKAMILFYEQNNLSYFKELFIEQFEFAVNTYFQA